jgi:hypothetical protein
LSESPSPPAFEFTSRYKGLWQTRWREQDLFVSVGGTEEVPDPALIDTLRDVVNRWTEVKETIAAFARGLASGHHVPLTPATIGGFAARSCGFEQPLSFESISVESPEHPHRVRVTFYTGFPDGYATYAVILDHGVPTEVSAFAS